MGHIGLLHLKPSCTSWNQAACRRRHRTTYNDIQAAVLGILISPRCNAFRGQTIRSIIGFAQSSINSRSAPPPNSAISSPTISSNVDVIIIYSLPVHLYHSKHLVPSVIPIPQDIVFPYINATTYRKNCNLSRDKRLFGFGMVTPVGFIFPLWRFL